MGKKKKLRSKSRPAASSLTTTTSSPLKEHNDNDISSATASAHSVDSIAKHHSTSSCPHLLKAVDLTALSSKIAAAATTPIRCEDCKRKPKHSNKKAAPASASPSDAIWVCLDCGHHTCGGLGLPTTPHCHAFRHAKQMRHPLASRSDKPLLCWCFHCKMPIQVVDINIQDADETTRLLSDAVKLLKVRSSHKTTTSVDTNHVGVKADASVTSEIKSKALITGGGGNSFGAHGGGYVVRGMVNLGNTCFFNSIMQNLLAMTKLRDSFLNSDAPVGGSLVSSLRKLFTETNPESGFKNIINPRSFFGCVCSKSPQFRGYQQHDSHEYLRCLLDGLSAEEIAARKHNVSPKKDCSAISDNNNKNNNSSSTLVEALFGGQISSTVCCIECGHFSTVYEPFLDLSLPVPTKKPPPSRKPQQVSRTKKAKVAPKKGGKSRTKGRRDADPLPAQSLSKQLSAPTQSNTSSVAGEMLGSSGDSIVLGSEEIISSMADKENLSSPPNLVAVEESQHMPNLLDNDAKNTSLASLDDFTWLDFVEARTVADEGDFSSQKEDSPEEVHDTENTDECSKELALHAATCESSGPVNILKDDKEDPNLRPDSSSVNVWEEEVPLRVQASEVLLLPYKEESSSAGEIVRKDGEASSSSILGCGQEELEFEGGLGDLFDEPEVVVAGPAPRPSTSDEVVGAGFIVGNNNSESDPDEVDDTDSPVSVESCLAHFIKPELLSDDNAWHCENCSKILQRQKMETKQQAKNISDRNDELGHAANSCSVKVGNLGDGDSGNDKDNESSFSNVKHFTELESDPVDELSASTGERDHEASEKEHKNNEDLQDSGSHKSCDEEICNHPAADSCSTVHTTGTVQKGDTRMFGQDSNDSGECSKEEADSKCVKVKRDATKRVLIYKAPPVLTIHLKRFSQDARGRLSKLNGHVNFREIMDLRPYMDPRCRYEENYEYHLVGVVEHLGTMRGGHYVAYVKGGQKNRGNANKGNEGSTWYHASDAHVREVSLDEVLRCEAYILFYEKN